MTKKALLISCFNWYKKRLEPIREILLQQKGYDEVKVLLADFDHIKKRSIENKYPECTYISVPKYKGNMSIRRIYSHLFFGWKVRKYLRTEQPDLVYCLVPPNNVGFYCKQYKKGRPKTKLILDIIDLWPESMPRFSHFSHFSHFPHLSRFLHFEIGCIWGKMRDDCVVVADHIFTECDFYKDKLGLPAEKTSTLYLFKEQTEEERKLVEEIIRDKDNNSRGIKDNKTRNSEDLEDLIDDNCDKPDQRERRKLIKFAYLGSMNHIIDIEGICSVIKQFIDAGYKCQLHAIGDGESREAFEQAVMKTGCLIYFYGAIFDEIEKIKILAPCDYGFNMMKRDVEVGLTIKSIDYLSYGLPLINNIKGDTWKLVEDEKIGINAVPLSSVYVDALYKSRNEHSDVLCIYKNYFTNCSFLKTIQTIFTDYCT